MIGQMDTKTRPSDTLTIRNPFHQQRHSQYLWKEEKIIAYEWEPKPKKIVFETRCIRRNKGHYIIIKKSIQQDDMKILLQNIL